MLLTTTRACSACATLQSHATGLRRVQKSSNTHLHCCRSNWIRKLPWHLQLAILNTPVEGRRVSQTEEFACLKFETVREMYI